MDWTIEDRVLFPEERIWIWVLLQAASDAEIHGRENTLWKTGFMPEECGRRKGDVDYSYDTWINSDDFCVGSFLWICDLLGWDVEKTRRGLEGLIDKKIATQVLDEARRTYCGAGSF